MYIRRQAMTQMLRKQIYIPKRQQAQLKRLAKKRGVSEAAIIRQAIEREVLLTVSRPAVGDRSALEEFIRFGLSRRVAEGTTGRTWTRDELYEERLSRYGRSGAQ
jgi:predicted transcriptional regulator